MWTFLRVNVADFAEAEKFYSNLPALAHFIHLQEAQGEDLQVENKVTWDLSMIKGRIGIFDVEVVKNAWEKLSILCTVRELS